MPEILRIIRAGASHPDRYPPLDASDPAYLAVFNAIDADPHNRLIVAEMDGALVGTLQITIIPSLPDAGRPRGLLENVHVLSGVRSQGIGGQLVKWAVNFCRDKDCWTVQLTSNKSRVDAHRFYTRIGFEQSHEGFKLLV